MTDSARVTTTFSIRVQPHAKRNAIVGMLGNAVKVCVTAPPADGRANEAVIKVLADWLGVRPRQVEIFTGATNRNKVVRVAGLTREQLDHVLAALG